MDDKGGRSDRQQLRRGPAVREPCPGRQKQKRVRMGQAHTRTALTRASARPALTHGQPPARPSIGTSPTCRSPGASRRLSAVQRQAAASEPRAASHQMQTFGTVADYPARTVPGEISVPRPSFPAERQGESRQSRYVMPSRAAARHAVAGVMAGGGGHVGFGPAIRRTNLDDLPNRSCPPSHHDDRRVYTNPIKPDTPRTLPRHCGPAQPTCAQMIEARATNQTGRHHYGSTSEHVR